MRIFLTGATGFIGSRVAPELLAAGHEVLGLTRSEAGARALAAAGVEPYRGTLEDPDGLRAGAEKADAVIHTAFDHEFSHFVANCEKDRRVVTAIGSALKGSGRPFLVTSGVNIGSAGPGQPALESVFSTTHPIPRIATEEAANSLLEAGVDVRIVRLPQVHDPVKQGLITPFIDTAREKGFVAHIGEGRNRWAAAPVGDVARLYALALERGRKGARYHAVAEEGVAMREIAETVGAGLGLPVRSLTREEAPAYFGWMTVFADLDMTASSAWTRQELGWHPAGPSLIEDLRAMNFAAPAAAA
ncbi:SDR family oxidoreductase [Aureimonas jatrophae]|uniref:Nucleoside-diphosphate-sugar epimerase n=1 Tax=Aureimonas jatrophae TaxID=1166073 RepID=A0A1H0HSR4_9HYPH|nr:SDR family oxidoreductase [Aureimonas jatrophae]MBB3950759.1 nucleoside-diphosphate-sugar epimerase [Aureimonas jatrophae]SDO22252.1 Nucleoside-diphosphate-sugar epimerase [Aureimonas jatrophae]